MSQRVKRLDRLVSSVLWALDQPLPSRELLPMLEQLLGLAPPGSVEERLAKHHLARLLVARDPWRAARLAREVLSLAECDATWSVLGMAQAVMGNYRSARRAYLQALALAPDNPSHQHNLGHLLDVAFGRPKEALSYLRAACLAVPGEPELASSYAHALFCLGYSARARVVLRRAMHSRDEVEEVLSRWGKPSQAALEAAEA